MTAQEAIQILKREYLGDSEFMELAKYMGWNALEKQIPKKVKEYKKGGYYCIDCKGVVYQKAPFCDNCGQALDWSDTE